MNWCQSFFEIMPGGTLMHLGRSRYEALLRALHAITWISPCWQVVLLVCQLNDFQKLLNVSVSFYNSIDKIVFPYPAAKITGLIRISLPAKIEVIILYVEKDGSRSLHMLPRVTMSGPSLQVTSRCFPYCSSNQPLSFTPYQYGNSYTVTKVSYLCE